MDQEAVGHFKGVYRDLSEWDIEQIDSQRETLTDEARHALDLVILERRIDLASMREELAAEQRVQAPVSQANLKAGAEPEGPETSKWWWIATFVLVPIFIMLGPARSYEALIGSITSGVVLGGIAWLVGWARRAHKSSRERARAPRNQ